MLKRFHCSNKIILLFIVLSFNNFTKCFQAGYRNTFSNEKLKEKKLVYDNNGFHIEEENKIINIASSYVDPKLQNLTVEQYKAFLANNYIVVKQVNNDEFVLIANTKIANADLLSDALLFLVNEIIKKANADRIYKNHVYYYNNYRHKDKSQIATVKAAHIKEAKDCVEKMYSELEKDGLIENNYIAFLDLKNQGYEINNKVCATLYPIRQIINEQEQKIKNEIIIKIVYAGLVKQSLKPDLVCSETIQSFSKK